VRTETASRSDFAPKTRTPPNRPAKNLPLPANWPTKCSPVGDTWNGLRSCCCWRVTEAAIADVGTSLGGAADDFGDVGGALSRCSNRAKGGGNDCGVRRTGNTSACATIVVLVGGRGMLLYFSTTNTLIQTSVSDAMRGRVMGIWALVFGGMMPIGGLESGLLSQAIGVPWTVAVGALVCAGAGLVTWWAVRRHDERRSTPAS